MNSTPDTSTPRIFARDAPARGLSRRSTRHVTFAASPPQTSPDSIGSWPDTPESLENCSETVGDIDVSIVTEIAKTRVVVEQAALARSAMDVNQIRGDEAKRIEAARDHVRVVEHRYKKLSECFNKL